MPSITKKEYARLNAAEEVCYGLMILLNVGLLDPLDLTVRGIIFKDMEKWIDLEPEALVKDENPKEPVTA